MLLSKLVGLYIITSIEINYIFNILIIKLNIGLLKEGLGRELYYIAAEGISYGCASYSEFLRQKDRIQTVLWKADRHRRGKSKFFLEETLR